jgi:quercetin dioxygenase-like cupin family protein
VQDSESPPSDGPNHHSGSARGALLYRNSDPDTHVDFTVERLPFKAEVLDPRVVRIPAGQSNERHRHAHETVVHVMSGTGAVEVGDTTCEVKPGDTVFVPRWVEHRASSRGPGELTYFAVTDFGFASKVLEREYLDGHRQLPENDRSFDT